jgi:cysteine-rich repeat protein
VLCKAPVCGDGFLQAGLGETCDDGGTSDGDPCSPLCKEQKALRITNGVFHSCALLNDGSVKCWGNNQFGHLGLGDTAHHGNGPNQMGDNLPTVKLFSALW